MRASYRREQSRSFTSTYHEDIMRGPMPKSHGLYVPDRVPGTRFRAMAALLAERNPYPSRRAFEHVLCNQIARRGVRFHRNSVLRFLTGAVTTIPRVAETALEDILEIRAGIPRADIGALIAARTPSETAGFTLVPIARITPLVALWLHAHPGKRHTELADALRSDPACPSIAAYVRVSLVRILQGRGLYVKPELVTALVHALAPQGITSEAEARTRHHALAAEITERKRDAELIPAAPTAALVRAWRAERGARSTHPIALAVQRLLTGTSQRMTHKVMREALDGRQQRIARGLAVAVGRAVHASCPALPEDPLLLDIAHPKRIARLADLDTMRTEPFIALARAWKSLHPEGTLMVLAQCIAKSVRAMRFAPYTVHSIRKLLTPPATTARIYVYRALLRQFGFDARAEPVPDAFRVRSLDGGDLTPYLHFLAWRAQLHPGHMPSDATIRFMAVRAERELAITRDAAERCLRELLPMAPRARANAARHARTVAPATHRIRREPPRRPPPADEADDTLAPRRDAFVPEDEVDLHEIYRRAR